MGVRVPPLALVFDPGGLRRSRLILRPRFSRDYGWQAILHLSLSPFGLIATDGRLSLLVWLRQFFSDGFIIPRKYLMFSIRLLLCMYLLDLVFYILNATY